MWHTSIEFLPNIPDCDFYHVRNVIQACELIKADGKMPQSCEAGNLLYFTQTVTMKVQHLEI